MPSTLGFNSKVFTLHSTQQITPSGRGYIQTLERTTPVWMAEYQTPGLVDGAYDDANAFLMSLDQSMNTFLAWDPRRVMPRAYQHMQLTADPWTRAGWAAPEVDAFDYEFSTLSLQGLVTGAIISPSDYISFFYDGIWYLFRTISGAVGSATGRASVEVRPRPYLPNTFTSAAVRYRKACCEMKMLGGYAEKDTVEENPSFSFKAVQFLNRSTPAPSSDPDEIWVTDTGFFISDETGDILLA